MGGPWEEHSCALAYRQIHSLAGSAEPSGFAEISGVARSAEALLKESLETRRLLTEAQKAQVSELVATLRQMAAHVARQVST